MKPTLKFAGLLLVAGTAATISAQTVDEIIAKNLEARGGLDKIKAVKTTRETGRLTQGDLRVRFIQENLRPNHVRQEIVVQGMSQIDAYDGHVGWRVSPFAGRKDPDLLSADDMKNLVIAADVDGELVDYRNKDHRAEYLGHDSVEGTDCYKIKLTLSSGDVRIFYIDTVVQSGDQDRVTDKSARHGTVHGNVFRRLRKGGWSVLPVFHGSR